MATTDPYATNIWDFAYPNGQAPPLTPTIPIKSFDAPVFTPSLPIRRKSRPLSTASDSSSSSRSSSSSTASTPPDTPTQKKAELNTGGMPAWARQLDLPQGCVGGALVLKTNSIPSSGGQGLMGRRKGPALRLQIDEMDRVEVPKSTGGGLMSRRGRPGLRLKTEEMGRI